MGVVAMSGNDTIIINNRNITDLAEGMCAKLTYSNDISQVKTGKNGNAIFASNTMGLQADLELRVVRGDSDDQFFNNLLSQQNANFAGFPLMIGQFIKKIGDGKGNITSDTYITSGGVFTRQVDAESSVEGDTNQSVAVYKMKFSNAIRVLT